MGGLHHAFLTYFCTISKLNMGLTTTRGNITASFGCGMYLGRQTTFTHLSVPSSFRPDFSAILSGDLSSLQVLRPNLYPNLSILADEWCASSSSNYYHLASTFPKPVQTLLGLCDIHWGSFRAYYVTHAFSLCWFFVSIPNKNDKIGTEWWMCMFCFCLGALGPRVLTCVCVVNSRLEVSNAKFSCWVYIYLIAFAF